MPGGGTARFEAIPRSPELFSGGGLRVGSGYLCMSVVPVLTPGAKLHPYPLSCSLINRYLVPLTTQGNRSAQTLSPFQREEGGEGWEEEEGFVLIWEPSEQSHRPG